MSLYSILHKDTIVYDKFKHFINDPRFIALINDYLQSDIDKLNLISENHATVINLNKTHLTIKVHPNQSRIPTPIAKINLNKNDITFANNHCHDIIDHTLTDLEEILYQGQ